MFRPSTERGMPALGCAASGREVTARTRSMASSMATGPTLQLQPITCAPFLEPGCESFWSRTIETISVLVYGHLCDERNLWIYLPGGLDCLMQFLQISKRFQYQQIDAALYQRRDLFAESGASFVVRSFAQRLNANS